MSICFPPPWMTKSLRFAYQPCALLDQKRGGHLSEAVGGAGDKDARQSKNLCQAVSEELARNRLRRGIRRSPVR
jgi:hypothetical protein